MAHNAYTAGRDGTAAGWPGSAAVTSAEFAWLAKGVFESINGDQGGTWAPASVITIGGAGAAFTTVSTSFFGITCNGNVTTDSVTVNGITLLNGAVTIGNSVSDSLTVYSAGAFIGEQEFINNVQITGGTSGTHKTLTVGTYTDVSVGSMLEVEGNTYLRGANTFYGLTVPSGYLVATDSEIRANGGIRQPIQTITDSGSITAGARYVVANISSGGFVTLPASGHPINAPIEIFNAANMSLEIRTPSGTAMASLTDASAVGIGQKYSITVYYDGSSWVILQSFGRLS